MRVPGGLETARLVLRRRRVEDAGMHRRLWTERDERVPAHRRIDADGHPTIEDIAAATEDAPGLLSVVRRDTGEVIGYCGLIVGNHGSDEEPTLAYELLQSVHGDGYATEAARAVVLWADEAGCRRLWADVRAWNVASRRVLAKLGFRDSGRVETDAVHGDSILTVREAGAPGVEPGRSA